MKNQLFSKTMSKLKFIIYITLIFGILLNIKNGFKMVIFGEVWEKVSWYFFTIFSWHPDNHSILFYFSRFMRTECLNHRYSHDAPMAVGRLIALVGNKMQICTQRYDKRPLGVGLLVAGYDVSFTMSMSIFCALTAV